MKSGLDYFPLDVRMDDEVKLIEAEFGLTGFAVIVKLYQKIYGERGYYCEFTKDVALLFACESVKLGVGVVLEILSASIRRGIFDKTLYDKYGILTSRGIQKRYFEAVGRRKSLDVENAYLLVPYTQIPKNVNISGKNVDISSENVDVSEQSKVKESKVNTITITTAPIPTPTLEEIEDYCRRNSLKLNPNKFFKYYSKRNWCTAKGKPIDDWYALAENWDRTNGKMPKETGSFDTDDFFEAAVERSYKK